MDQSCIASMAVLITTPIVENTRKDASETPWVPQTSLLGVMLQVVIFGILPVVIYYKMRSRISCLNRVA